MTLAERCLSMLDRWFAAAESHCYTLPDRPDLRCYGTGYNSWGVQTNQKYLAAAAVLGNAGHPGAATAAHAALRFSVSSHRSGDAACTDGTQWGHTWISALGVERMMHGVAALTARLTPEDHTALRRMLVSEADWICFRHQRGRHTGIFADRWNASGKNAPESNIWNGCLLWRAALGYPDEANAPQWRRTAEEFLANGVSVPADLEDSRIVAGKPVKEWVHGANFFPHYTLDHHGYTNVGYMVICVSNVAMLHFALRERGEQAPAFLHHHQTDLWQVLSQFLFPDGRLCRFGGDSRLRYTYCQDYVLPALLYAAHHLGDPGALETAKRFVDIAAAEQDANEDGSFFGKRLEELAGETPYYYTRLESDRAVVLSMLASWLEPAGGESAGAATAAANQSPAGPAAVATSSAWHGPPSPTADAARHAPTPAFAWHEPEHGDVFHRCATRIASFAWRAYGLTQGLCVPPGQSDLAEWERNLAGAVDVADVPRPGNARELPSRRLEWSRQASFDGGFLTWGVVTEGASVSLAEGWRGADSARHVIAFAALPDGHTVLCVQHCRAADRRVFLRRVQGMHLNVPNDLFNGFERIIESAGSRIHLPGPPAYAARVQLSGNWLVVDGVIGAIGIYGADGFTVDRSPRRRGGTIPSLFVDEIAWGMAERFAANPGEPILDCGWAVMTSCHAEAAATAAAGASRVACPEPLRAVSFSTGAGEFLLAANPGDAGQDLHGVTGSDVVTGAGVGGTLHVAAGEARLVRVSG